MVFNSVFLRRFVGSVLTKFGEIMIKTLTHILREQNHNMPQINRRLLYHLALVNMILS